MHGEKKLADVSFLSAGCGLGLWSVTVSSFTGCALEEYEAWARIQRKAVEMIRGMDSNDYPER